MKRFFLLLLMQANLISCSDWLTPEGSISLKQILRKSPNSIHKIIFNNKNNNSNFVVEFENGRVFEDGLVITNDNLLFKDVVVKSHGVLLKDHHIFMHRDDVNTKKINGTVAVIASPGANCYYHWLLQILPRFELLKRSGLQYDYIYLFPLTEKYQFESLTLLGIDLTKVIYGYDNQQIVADKILVPSISINNGAKMQSWVAGFLKEKILKKETGKIKKRKIFISRKKAKVRRIINEDEVINFLAGYGFEPVCLEDFNLQEQAEIMNSADMVIAPHGSGITNVVFCNKGSTIVEIFNFEGFTQPFNKICKRLGLKHYSCFTNDINIPEEQKKLGLNCDIYVDINELKKLLDK